MIPTVLVLAFIGGLLFPRRLVWVAAIATVLWIGLLMFQDSNDAASLLGGAALGGVNAVMGVAGAWVIRRT